MSYFPEIVQDGLRFIIAKISDSRKELEIRLASDDIGQNENFIFNLGGTSSQVSRIDFYERLQIQLQSNINSNESDVVVPINDGSYIPLVNVNYFRDNFIQNNDVNKILFVIKLNKPLPPSFKKLSKISLLKLKSDIISNEIIYGGALDETPQKFGKSLDYDYTQNIFDTSIKETSTYENKNQLSSSLPNYRLDTISSGSNYYKKRLVDYSDFNNFVHFSSAEKRLENFKIKLENIESDLTIISKSLKTEHQNNSTINRHTKQIREQSFTNINNIINNFTEYENWLYYDNQITSTTSAPGIGQNYTNSSSSLNLSKNISQQFNKEGLDVVYILSGSSTETITIVDNKYNLDDTNFNNSTGSFYLSFLLRASSSVSNNLKHKNTLTSSIPNYPMDSLNLQTMASPTSTGSAYKRYIFASSGSHWTTTNTKTLGLNTIDFGKNSSDIILTSGSSIFNNVSSGVGQYSKYLTGITGSGTFVSGSFVPRGDLFNITIAPTNDTNLSGIITDVKITKNNPENILPFHILHSTDSTEFTTWYNGMISSASFYDSQNIQRLMNNVPSTYINDVTTNRELIQYVDTIGEFFDEYKTFIDDYYRLFNKGYSDYQEVPSKYNKLLAENLGFNLLPIQENNFLNFFGLNDNIINSKDYSDGVINNVLNNLSYLYKTKGTRNSLNALLSCYGIPTNVLKIKEGHTHLKNYDQDFLSNDTRISANDIFNHTGSFAHEVKTNDLNSIIINETFDSDNFKFKWNPSSEITQSSIEAIFKMAPTSNTMSLFSNYANNDSSLLWQVNIVPSTTNTRQGKFQFRLSSETNGSSDLVSNSSLAETDFLNVLDNSLINVMLQKSSSGLDISSVHTYELVVGKTTDVGGKFLFLTSSKLEIDGDSDSTSNKNFISGSIGNHLFIANNYTGSVSQIKSYSTPLSMTAFKQHVYNKNSIVGNKFSSSLTELQYYYPLQENYVSGSTNNFILQDSSTNQKGGTIELDSNLFNSMSNNYDTTLVENISFPIFGDGGGFSISSDNLITTENSQLLTGNLNPNTSVLRYNNKIEEPEFNHSRNLYFSRSPQEIINDFLKDNLGNLDFNDLFADPRDEFKNTYPDLNKFNDDLKKYNISVDLTRFIEATKKIFNNSIIESIKKLLPAKAKLNVGTTIKPTYTTRTKISPLKERPSVELQIQPEGTKTGTAAGAPNFNGTELFLPPEDTLFGFQTPTSELGSFEGTTFGFTGEDNEYNLNDLIFEPDVNQFPQKFWGPSVSDVHFKSNYGAGISNDNNTYHYEDRAVFTSLTDPERIIHTTGSNKILNTNYATSSTFVNKKLIKLSEATSERFLGVTQELFITSSNIEPFGKMIDSDTRIPIRHIYNLRRPSYYSYEGTKLGPIAEIGNVTNHPGHNLFNANFPLNPFGYGNSNTQEWEDLSTASFYRVELSPNNTNRLRIVKEGQEQAGNQIN